jgi:Winged helix-turn helix
MFPSGIALAITARYAAGHCRSPIEMSLPSPIEMSLGQAVVETFGVACDEVIQMSERELTRLRVLIDLSDQRLTVEAAARLMGVGRRQVYRLRRAFAAGGPVALVSRKRGRPSNHRHGETFRRTVLTLVREHYPNFGPTLAVEKLAARHGLRVGVETLRQWMMSDGLWKDRRPRRISRVGGGTVWANW